MAPNLFTPRFSPSDPTHLFLSLSLSFCSFDIRDRDAKSAKRWSDETVFGNRAYFIFDKQPGQLAIQHVRDEDTGLYRCRVDFQVAQTRNSIVNLTVIGK